MAFNKLSLAEKISTKAIKVGDCLIWQGQKDKRGYGFLRLDGRLQRAHRIAFVLRNGPIPEGMVILHACDNPSCVNPDHLSMGTQHANVRDMLDKGRANKATGNRNAKTKLTQSCAALSLRSVRLKRLVSRMNMKPPSWYCEDCCSFDCGCWYVDEISRLRRVMFDAWQDSDWLLIANEVHELSGNSGDLEKK